MNSSFSYRHTSNILAMTKQEKKIRNILRDTKLLERLGSAFSKILGCFSCFHFKVVSQKGIIDKVISLNLRICWNDNMQNVVILQKQSLGYILKNILENIIVKYLFWSLVVKNTAGYRPETLLKRYSSANASC